MEVLKITLHVINRIACALKSIFIAGISYCGFTFDLYGITHVTFHG